MHSVQHVTINTFEAFLDIAKFWPFLLYFMGIFGAKKFQVFENGSNLILPDRLGIGHVKNHNVIHCLCLVPEKNNQQTPTKRQVNSSADTFFLDDPLYRVFS